MVDIIPMNDSSDIETRIAQRLKSRRETQGLTLEQLAERSAVSRAMISRVERGESSPTAALLGKLCAGLGITLSSLMAGIEEGGRSVLLKAGAQPFWRDPDTGFERRAVTPGGTPSPVEIVQGMLPAGARIDYPALNPAHYDQHILGQDGLLRFHLGEQRFDIGPGDCLYTALDQPHGFFNPGRKPARYLVIIAKSRG